MSVQTTYAPRLCDLLEYGFDLGLRDYPIYDESDRARLNQAIVNHFYTREIAAESPALFIMRLNVTMSERMPQINKVHELLKNADLASSFEQTTEGSTGTQSGSTSTSTAQSTAQAKNYNSNAPQVSMLGKDEVSYYDTGQPAQTMLTARAAMKALAVPPARPQARAAGATRLYRQSSVSITRATTTLT